MKYTHILFDLDGTLTNSLEGISNSFKHALNKMEIEYDLKDEWEWVVGPPLIESFGKLNIAPEKIGIAVSHYREKYNESGWQENQVYEGIPKMLDSLKNAGVKLYLATGKTEFFALKILEYFSLAQYFDGIAGSLPPIRLLKHEVIKFVLEEFKIPKHSALMVGDRELDVTGAHINGIHAAGVLYGFGNMEELESSDPELLCTTVKELESHLTNI